MVASQNQVQIPTKELIILGNIPVASNLAWILNVPREPTVALSNAGAIDAVEWTVSSLVRLVLSGLYTTHNLHRPLRAILVRDSVLQL